jgi:hypothetical protein
LKKRIDKTFGPTLERPPPSPNLKLAKIEIVQNEGHFEIVLLFFSPHNLMPSSKYQNLQKSEKV